jgi:hypothetical protein
MHQSTMVIKKNGMKNLKSRLVKPKTRFFTGRLRIVWQGGETTTKEISIPIKRFKELPFAKECEEKVIELAQLGNDDKTTAEYLTAVGYRSAMHQYVLPSTVQAIRLKHGIMLKRSQSHPRQIPGFLTVPQLAKRLNIRTYQIYYLIGKGKIAADKDLSSGLYLFPDTEETIKIYAQKFKIENF